jgi:hypothetical protein
MGLLAIEFQRLTDKDGHEHRVNVTDITSSSSFHRWFLVAPAGDFSERKAVWLLSERKRERERERERERGCRTDGMKQQE